MSTSRDDVGSVYPETLAIPARVTCVLSPIPGQLGCILKYVSGGSLVILRNPEFFGNSNMIGTTTVGSTFAINNVYTIGANEIINLSANQFMYLTATGSTCVASILRLRSDGT